MEDREEENQRMIKERRDALTELEKLREEEDKKRNEQARLLRQSFDLQ